MATPVTLLGVRLDGLTAAEARDRAGQLLRAGNGAYVVTPNPEMLVEASRDAGFRQVLNGAAFSLADGFGIQLMCRLTGRPVPPRTTGTDFLGELCGVAAEAGASVALVGGGGDGVAEAAAAALCARHPSLRVAGTWGGSRVQVRADADAPHLEESLMRELAAAAPDVVVVAFGHGVQERFLAARLAELPSVRLGIGVGGALDFWSGRVRRAPRWVRAIGMEWAWRLVLQPWRWRRILTALVVFPWLVLQERMR